MKTIKMLSLGVMFAIALFSCEDPMEEIKPIQEEPLIETDGTGDGSGGGGCPFGGCK